MPYIPLLKTNTDLAMPQVPALDRVPRPNIDVRGVLAAMEDLGRASQMPLVDERPFVEAAGAKGKAVGRGLMDIGDVMGALAIKRLEAHEDLQVQRFHADTRRENERRSAYQAGTPDANHWMPDAQRGAEAVTKRYENMTGVRPQVQHTLRGMATSYKRVVKADTGARVDKARFAETARAIAENFEAAKEFGDYDGADKLAVHGRELHYFSEEQMQGMLAQTAQRRREDQLMTVVQEHPREAPGWFAQEEKLTEYKLTPWERREWEHRAQVFWEDHERSAVGRVLDGIASGQISQVRQLEGWKQDLGDKAYADISEMLTARRPAVAKNDPVLKEQTMATIANAQARQGDVNSQIGLAKLGEDIKNFFTGGDRDELLGRLEKRVNSPDAGRESILAVGLRKLNDWAFGYYIVGINSKGSLVDEDSVSIASGESANAMAERVKSIREDLEKAITTGKLQTKDDATDFVAQRVIGEGWKLPEAEAASSDGGMRLLGNDARISQWLPPSNPPTNGPSVTNAGTGAATPAANPRDQGAAPPETVERPKLSSSGTPFSRVIVSGGINSEFDKDQSHDRHWGNYVRAAETEIKRATKHLKDGETIEWHVQRSSLEARARIEKHPEDYYTKQVEEIAEKEGVRLRWFNTTKDFVSGINTAPTGAKRSGSSLISNFKFFGHGGEASIWMTYKASSDGSPPQGGEVLMSTDLPSRHLSSKHRDTLLNLPTMAGRVIDPAAFAPGAVCTSWACNSATGKPAFIDAWTNSLGVSMMGIEGKSNYGPTSSIYAPWSFEYGDLIPSKRRPETHSARYPVLGKKESGNQASWRVAKP